MADGGTGASTAANARTNLGAAASGTNADITSMTGITGGIATADFIQFDTAATVTDATGKLYYNKEDQFQTLAFQMNGSAVQKIGEELYYRVKLTANAAKGDVMMFTGTIGASGGLTAAPATGLTADQANYILGIATEAGSTNDWIFVTNFGEVKGIDTTGGGESWVQGQILYYNPSVTGGLTKTKPTTPNAIAVMAAVVHVHASNGILFVRPSFGSVLGGTDGNVQFGTLNNGDVIVYDSGDARWENKAQSTLTAGSVNGSATITSGTISGITALSVAGTSSTTGEIKLYEDTDNGTNYVGIKAPASISADISWTLPAADGASGQLLSTNGSGTLSWTTPAGGGDVSGPASSTDNAIVRFDLTSGKAIQNSVATLSDTGVLTTAEVSTDTISEKTAAAGVTIDGVLLKDSAVTTDTINEKTAAAGVTIDGTLLKDKAVYPDGADTNTFIAVPVADTVAITTNGSERLRVNSTGDVGIGTNSPGSALDVKGTVRLSGATSGYVGLAPAAAAGSTTYTLPSADGTSGQMLSTNGSGVLSWATAAVGANGNVSIGFVGSAVNSTGSSLVWNSTGSLTWTVPTGVTKCKVTVLGGGGGGGGTSNATPIGAGGGAGGCAIKWVTGLTPGGTVAVTVGAAGTTGSNAAGGAGGTSSFGSHASATGGSGGGRNNASTIQTSGTNGAGSSGDINISGDVKISSVYGVELAGGSADRFNSVAGADAPLGLGFGGRERIQTGANQAGVAATGYGAGGGGAIYVSGNQAGGAATPGIVIIEW